MCRRRRRPSCKTQPPTQKESHTPREEQKKPPPWWKETGSPRVLLLCRCIQYNPVLVQLNPVPLRGSNPRPRDSCRVYASQVGQSTPSRIRRDPCLAGDGSIQKKEYIRVEGRYVGSEGWPKRNVCLSTFRRCSISLRCVFCLRAFPDCTHRCFCCILRSEPLRMF
jgi:hypothetical protein